MLMCFKRKSAKKIIKIENEINHYSSGVNKHLWFHMIKVLIEKGIGWIAKSSSWIEWEIDGPHGVGVGKVHGR